MGPLEDHLGTVLTDTSENGKDANSDHERAKSIELDVHIGHGFIDNFTVVS